MKVVISNPLWYLPAIRCFLAVMIPGFGLTAASRKSYIKQEVLKENFFITDPTVKQYKFNTMKGSPFAFFRATNHLYYKDLNTEIIPVPSDWTNTPNISTWIQGDLHTQNFGFFTNNNDKIVFDINDFDESFIAPFYWDLIRYVTSIYLMENEMCFTMTSSETDNLAMFFLEKYQDTLESVVGNDTEVNAEMVESNLSGFVLDTLHKLKNEKSNTTLLNEWTALVGGDRKFDFTNSKLAPLSAAEAKELIDYYASYLTDISSLVSANGDDYFRIKDMACRLESGMGSLGVKKYYLLIEGPGSSMVDDIILEVKEERLPSMFLNPTLTVNTFHSDFANHALCAKTANMAMGRKVDKHTGVLTSNLRTYLVRKISPWKHRYLSSDFKSQSALQDYLKYTAIALGYAHSRADKDYRPLYISYSFEKNAVDAIKIWPKFKTTVINLAKSYSGQVKSDYDSFMELMNAGEVSSY